VSVKVRRLSTRLNTRWSRDRPKPANFEDSSVHGAVENMRSFCEDRGDTVLVEIRNLLY